MNTAIDLLTAAAAANTNIPGTDNVTVGWALAVTFEYLVPPPGSVGYLLKAGYIEPSAVGGCGYVVTDKGYDVMDATH